MRLRSDDDTEVPAPRATKLFIVWFLIGASVVALFQFAHSQAVGGYAGLLRAGDPALRPVIAAELPDLPPRHDLGHDGQISYVQGLDLLGDVMPDLFPDASAAYRYRRIAYPALASLGGLLSGETLLAGMVLVSIISVGLAAAAAAAIARHYSKSPWLALSVVLNPGVWLSALLLTSDNLALAGGLLAVLAVLKGRIPWAITSLAVAALAKEVAVVFAVGLSGHLLFDRQRRAATVVLAGSLTPLLLWSFYLNEKIGGAFGSSGNLGLPLQGLIEAARVWGQQAVDENVFNAIILSFLLLGTVSLRRMNNFWRCLLVPWILLGVLVSHLVWDVGNNSMRTLAPIIILTILGSAVGSTTELSTQERSPQATLAHT